MRRSTRCILSKFYIKPQQFREAHWEFFVVSYRNSTSNHNIHCRYIDFRRVVSYRNSTSNHNTGPEGCEDRRVVSYRNSTSNHNNFEKRTGNFLLYLIEILHQTTTYTVGTSTFVVLYLIEILHQTTTLELEMSAQQRCILSKFYIKPQLRCILGYTALGCILSKFYIKPQQLREAHWELFRCILSKFYIKPQHI